MSERMQLSIEDADGLQFVRVRGELDAFAAKSFQERMGIFRRADRYVVDLGSLSFIDSAGLHALFTIGRVAKDVGARIVFVVPCESPVRRLIEMVKLGDLTPVCESLDAAVMRLPAYDLR
jgi:anti-anti-sigma factor